jgi:integrase
VPTEKKSKGAGRVFQRNERWWVAYWGFLPNGEMGEVRESAGETEDDARDLLRERLIQVRNRKRGLETTSHPSLERVLVGELLDDLVVFLRVGGKKRTGRPIKSLEWTIGRDGKGGHLAPIRDHFGAMKAFRVTTAKIEQYIEARQTAGRSSATINREVQLLGQAFRRAANHDTPKLARIPRIPMLSEQGNEREGFVERHEFNAIVKHLDGPFAAIAEFGYLTGWRRGEILGLEWSRIDLADGVIRLPGNKTKSGAARSIGMGADLAGLMERQWKARAFQSPEGEGLSPFVFHVGGEKIPTSTFQKRWKAARKAAHLPDVLFHDLRRTAIRDLVRAGVSRTIAKKISGHKTDSVFDRYNISDAEDTGTAQDSRAEYLDRREAKLKARGIAGGNVRAFRQDSDKNSDK